ncbi:MAG: hypothetical protein ABI782_06550, partial [Anaerolineaceae bacterium]
MTSTETHASASDFPIHWENPSDEQAFWFQDVMHSPQPFTPLTATLFQPAFSEGASRAIARLSMPISGLRVSIQNGYLYLGPVVVMGTPEELGARFGEMQRLTMELAPTAHKDWLETFEPRVTERARHILAFDYENSSIPEVARFARTLYAELVDVWDIHMRVNIPTMNVVFGFEEFLTATLGDDAVGQSRLLLQGFDSKSIQTGRALWELSRWVRGVAGLDDVVLGGRVRGGAIELRDHPQADAFRQRFDAFLETHGWRSDVFFEVASKSWREDPSTPLTQMKAYLGRDDAQDPFLAHARQAAERDSLVAEMAARLPAEARPQFHHMLHMAQQYVPIAEDHNFTIDQGFTTVIRHAFLELGRKLAEEGRLADPEDVCYLTFA